MERKKPVSKARILGCPMFPSVTSALDDFYDESHVNAKGAQSATAAICELLQRQDRGESISDLFYTWEEYVKSIDYVAATYMIVGKDEDAIHATAYSVIGTEKLPEYKFVIYDTKNDMEKTVLQDFDVINEITVSKEMLSKGALSLRVYARAEGEKGEDYVRYYDYQLSGT